MAEKDDAAHRRLEELIVEAAHCDWFSPPGNVADALLAAGWRPPLPDASDELNVLLGIDDVEKIYTQADLVDACARTLERERVGQTAEWGYRRVGEPDHLIRKASAMEAQAAIQRDGFEVVYRVVKPWKADD